jgi:sulfide:quinone oxidoreductase
MSGLPCKCPAAVYEAALLLDRRFRRRKIRDDIEISVFTPEALPLGAANARIGQRIVELLGNEGSAYAAGERWRVDHRSREVRFETERPPFSTC